ncbi:hypothetical protein [Haloechinothrix sp. LS1_15]|uniref:hypothetical protein n=1 Tax=Haloechinothrix sp. LS1_15 TaxID=2652248 RepID=UPI0029442E02|nr:hypothetical protein [Haloechinothrix sp. LS1_15]MDV6012422.1 hypothetical protein [Haloechinothrix sp. LS1_15]
MPDAVTLRSWSLEELLGELRRRRWTLLRWGSPVNPELLAAIAERHGCADVVILRAEEDATGYRATSWGASSVLTPRTVSYQYHATAVWTLRAMLALPSPGAEGAPMAVETPHPRCSVPDCLPPPIVIRPL